MSDLVVQPERPELLRPIATPKQILEVQKETHQIIQEALEKGRDYGSIPGAGDRPVLLKPGAERLCTAFGCHPDYEVLEKEIDHDRENVSRDRYGKERRSQGLYRYVVKCLLRRGDVVVASGVASCSTMESKYISRPRDVENTVLKMAQKRAFVAATLNAFALSDRFTQDIEETPVSDRRESAPVVDAEPVADEAYSGIVPRHKGLLVELAHEAGLKKLDKSDPLFKTDYVDILKALSEKAEGKLLSDLKTLVTDAIQNPFDHA